MGTWAEEKREHSRALVQQGGCMPLYYTLRTNRYSQYTAKLLGSYAQLPPKPRHPITNFAYNATPHLSSHLSTHLSSHLSCTYSLALVFRSSARLLS